MILFWIEQVNGSEKLIKRVLRSNFLWRISGFNFYSAVYATKGSILSLNSYLQLCKDESEFIKPFLTEDSVVLEFGSGLGGNLLSMSNLIREGHGIDINSWYVHLANKIKDKLNAQNISFASYDGKTLPNFDVKFDIIFSMNVFERIPKKNVELYITQLVTLMKDGGRMFLFFLNESAINTTFVKRLGVDAYVFWSKEEIRNLCSSLGLKVTEIMDWKNKAYMVFLNL